MKKLILTTLFLLCLSGTVLAQSGEEVTFEWTAPAAGSPVEEYVVQLSINGDLFIEVERVTKESFTYFFNALTPYNVRVAGVDFDGHQGPFSDPSAVLVLDYGPPGKPGKPIKIGG